MVKCDICKEIIETTFLNKIKGTYIKVNKKQKAVCNVCQAKHNKEEILDKLKQASVTQPGQCTTFVKWKPQVQILPEAISKNIL